MTDGNDWISCHFFEKWTDFSVLKSIVLWETFKFPPFGNHSTFQHHKIPLKILPIENSKKVRAKMSIYVVSCVISIAPICSLNLKLILGKKLRKTSKKFQKLISGESSLKCELKKYVLEAFLGAWTKERHKMSYQTKYISKNSPSGHDSHKIKEKKIKWNSKQKFINRLS